MFACENTLCIYQDNGACAFQTMAINEYGMCAHCFVVDIQDEELKRLKDAMLQRLHCREEEMGWTD